MAGQNEWATEKREQHAALGNATGFHAGLILLAPALTDAGSVASGAGAGLRGHRTRSTSRCSDGRTERLQKRNHTNAKGAACTVACTQAGHGDAGGDRERTRKRHQRCQKRQWLS